MVPMAGRSRRTAAAAPGRGAGHARSAAQLPAEWLQRTLRPARGPLWARLRPGTPGSSHGSPPGSTSPGVASLSASDWGGDSSGAPRSGTWHANPRRPRARGTGRRPNILPASQALLAREPVHHRSYPSRELVYGNPPSSLCALCFVGVETPPVAGRRLQCDGEDNVAWRPLVRRPPTTTNGSTIGRPRATPRTVQ